MKDIYVICGGAATGKSSFVRNIYNKERDLFKKSEPLSQFDFFIKYSTEEKYYNNVFIDGIYFTCNRDRDITMLKNYVTGIVTYRNHFNSLFLVTHNNHKNKVEIILEYVLGALSNNEELYIHYLDFNNGIRIKPIKRG